MSEISDEDWVKFGHADKNSAGFYKQRQGGIHFDRVRHGEVRPGMAR